MSARETILGRVRAKLPKGHPLAISVGAECRGTDCARKSPPA